MTDDLKIPPRGSANLHLTMETIPHGWEIRAVIRSLQREGGNDRVPEYVYPWVVLWTQISLMLKNDGYDLGDALEHLPDQDPNGGAR